MCTPYWYYHRLKSYTKTVDSVGAEFTEQKQSNDSVASFSNYFHHRLPTHEPPHTHQIHQRSTLTRSHPKEDPWSQECLIALLKLRLAQVRVSHLERVTVNLSSVALWFTIITAPPASLRATTAVRRRDTCHRARARHDTSPSPARGAIARSHSIRALACACRWAAIVVVFQEGGSAGD